MKTSFKKIFESDNWIIIEILQGTGQHRINAKKRFPAPDENSYFSRWGKTSYLEKLARENYGKKLSEFTTYKY